MSSINLHILGRRALEPCTRGWSLPSSARRPIRRRISPHIRRLRSSGPSTAKYVANINYGVYAHNYIYDCLTIMHTWYVFCTFLLVMFNLLLRDHWQEWRVVHISLGQKKSTMKNKYRPPNPSPHTTKHNLAQ